MNNLCTLDLLFQKKGKKKKDESEEGEISSNDEREEEFDDGLDEDLIGKQIIIFIKNVFVCFVYQNKL